MNTCNIMGRLTAAPELKTTQEGVEYATFSVAVLRPSKDKDAVDFINCKAWRTTAAFIAKYFDKGKMIACTGAYRVDKYVDRDGNNRIYSYMEISHAEFCGGKSDDNGQARNTAAPRSEPQTSQGTDAIPVEDDLPF